MLVCLAVWAANVAGDWNQFWCKVSSIVVCTDVVSNIIERNFHHLHLCRELYRSCACLNIAVQQLRSLSLHEKQSNHSDLSRRGIDHWQKGTETNACREISSRVNGYVRCHPESQTDHAHTAANCAVQLSSTHPVLSFEYKKGRSLLLRNKRLYLPLMHAWTPITKGPCQTDACVLGKVITGVPERYRSLI